MVTCNMSECAMNRKDAFQVDYFSLYSMGQVT